MHIPAMDSSWDAIDSGLNKIQRKKRFVFWFSFATLLLLGFFGVIKLVSVQDSNDKGNYADSLSDIQKTNDSLNDVSSNYDRTSQVDLNGIPVEDLNSEILNFDVKHKVSNTNKASISNYTSTGPSQSDFAKRELPNLSEETDVTKRVNNDLITSQTTAGAVDIKKKDFLQETVDVANVPEIHLAETPVENNLEHPTESLSTERSPTDRSNSESPIGNWELGLSVSPGLAANLTSESRDFAWMINEKYFTNTENQGISRAVQMDLSLKRHMLNGLYFGIGMRYVSREEAVSYDYRIDRLVTIREAQKEIIYGAPLAPPLRVHVEYDGTNRYDFVDIPARLGFIKDLKPSGGLKYFAELNVSYSYLMLIDGKRVDGTFLTLQDIASMDINRNSIGAAAQIGLLKELGRRTSLSSSLIYNTNLGSWRAKESGLIERPYNYGLTFGLNYRLSK